MSTVRDELRAKIFAETKLNIIPVEFFGATIELRQPQLQDILAAQKTEDREAAVIETLIEYAFIPGTDERVFETGDAAGLKAKPFGADFLRISKALEDLTEVNFLDKPQSSNVDLTSTSSTKSA